MNRVQRTTEFLEPLQSIRHQGRQSIVIVESWFYWRIDWGQQWLPDDDKLGTQTRRGVNHNKTMLTIVWNPNSFHLIDAMPKGEKYSA
jgi:hypothetical protein